MTEIIKKPETVNQEELVTYQGKIVKKGDLAQFLSQCMIQVTEIMQTLKLEALDIEGDLDESIMKVHVDIKHEKRIIQLIH